MKLTIISLTGKVEHHVAWIEVETPDGNFIIQPEHVPTTFILSEKRDLTYCLSTGKLETITIHNAALLSVERSSALLLMNSE